MNTEDRDWIINDYIDGLLDDSMRRDFEQELAADPALQAEVAEIRTLLKAASSLPLSIEPPRDLWDGIEARIKREGPSNTIRFPRQGRRLWGGFSAFAAAAALVAVGGLTYWNYTQLQSQPVPATQGPDTAPPPIAVAQNNADAAYAQARAALLDALAKRKEALPPETQATLRDTMAVIDNAIHELNVALADDPENPALLHMIVATRDKELNLLEQLVSGPQGL